CGSVFGLALASFLGFFGYENIFLGYLLTIYGITLLFIIIYLLLVKETKDKDKYIVVPLFKTVKSVISWTFNNFKFIFIPGYTLEDLNERQRQHEISYPKINRIYRYKSALFIIGICTIMLLCTVAVFQNWISPYSFVDATIYEGLSVDIEWYGPPRPEHLLGQTFMGFDILARIIFGTGPTLIFAVGSTLIASFFGILIGAISGYYEGWLGVIIMRIMDIILSFPGIVFAIVFMTIWGSDFVTLVIIYSIIGIPYFARLMRTNVSKEKVLPYITAGKVAGAKSPRILFRHILPNCMQSYIVGASYNISRNILSLAALGFLRFSGNWLLGSVFDVGWIEWGYDISVVLVDTGRLGLAPWAVIYPSMMILIAVVGFLLLGDSLSDIRLLKQEKL
ncbi:MAG: ABC transporter permease, partial [Promethearchaeota archaeon]